MLAHTHTHQPWRVRCCSVFTSFSLDLVRLSRERASEPVKDDREFATRERASERAELPVCSARCRLGALSLFSSLLSGTRSLAFLLSLVVSDVAHSLTLPTAYPTSYNLHSVSSVLNSSKLAPASSG